jgi:glycosyltransferase involved in cell wall biosynthesis
MSDHADASAWVAFAARGIDLSAGAAFVLDLSPGLRDVVDVYDLDDPVHPRGHLGWWQFPIEGHGQRIEGALVRDGDMFVPRIASAEPSKVWINERQPRCVRFVVIAALRARPTNALVDMDRVPAMADASALAAFRAGSRLGLSADGLARPDFAVPAASTVRIVSHHIVDRDAVGNLCIDLHRLLRAAGVPCALYAHHFELAYDDTVRRKRLLAGEITPADQLVYMHSTFDPDLPHLLELACARRVAYFHGVTQPALFRVFDPELAVNCEKAIAQIALLEGFDALATNSRATARTMLGQFGPDTAWREADVHIAAPKLITAAPQGPAKPRPAGQGARLLSVGRVVAHKKVEHVLALFAQYLRHDPDAECWIVGGGGPKAYRDYLVWVEATELALPPGRVHWFGSVTDARLDELYAGADALVCMSEHEGFCLPVLEAMAHGLPVFAYGLEAVREVLGDAGRWFAEKDFAALAANLHALLEDDAALAGLIARQHERARTLIADMDGRPFWRLLAPTPA